MDYSFDAFRDSSKCERKIKVNGRGIVEAEPDMVLLSLSVVTKDINPQTAQNLNEQASKRLINALLQMGIPEEDIRTTSYTIYPEYDFINGQQQLAAYNVTHTLEIKLGDINKAGAVINVAVQNGANQINSVNFTIEDSKHYYNKALRQAVKDAGVKAQNIANTMRVSLYPIPCSVVELGANIAPMSEQGMLKLAAEPVMPGRIEITAAVEAEFEYKP